MLLVKLLHGRIVMLLNLSNHPAADPAADPAAGWSTAQLLAAQAQFGTVEDLPFPAIPPAWNADEVAALAKEYAARCEATLAGQAEGEHAVHVMGEMTFTYALVGWLQARGIRCVASTTVRLSEPQADGTRRVSFRFERFRDYPRAQTDDVERSSDR